MPQRRKKNRLGQSAAELAVFGSIVIFVIGIILKTSLSLNHRANMDLRTFRMALQESYQTSLGKYSSAFSAGRNSASLLVIEDRLTIDPSKKQGTRDRSPYVSQAGGTMSINLFMEVDPSNQDDLPVFDIFINGQRFPLSVSRVVTKTPSTNTDIHNCINPNGILNDGDEYGDSFGACRKSNGTFRFFRKAYNGEGGSGAQAWCTSGGCHGWSVEHRFDLDFDGAADFDIVTAIAPALGLLRDAFAWQWVPVEQSEVAEGVMVDIDGDLKEEKILSCSTLGAFSCLVLDKQDADFDLTWDEGSTAFYTRIGRSFQKPGLSQDIRAYSFTAEGTMLKNEEGRLFSTASPNGQFIRNETRQDHVDIIERVLRLSNDTKRFCSNATTPAIWGNTAWARSRGLLNMHNPVEACGSCFSVVGGVDHRKLTCMDTTGPTIFVRSRIRDRRRSRWVTLTGSRD